MKPISCGSSTSTWSHRPILTRSSQAEYPNRTLFWGATRNDRWIFVVCEDWKQEGVRYLRPITAFEPEVGKAVLGGVPVSSFDYKPASSRDLEREARDWELRVLTPRDWSDAPEGVPRAGASTTISLRMPGQMLAILKAFAKREGIGYQVLMKRWLDERIQKERDKLGTRPAVKSRKPEIGGGL